MNRLSKYEWQILCLFLFALLVSTVEPRLLLIVAFYPIGIGFELVTESMWDYNPELRDSPLTLPNRDVNLLFGLGWVALVLMGLTVGERLRPHLGSLVGDVAGVLLVGNICESLFYHFGLWQYNSDHPWLKFPIPYLGKYVLFGGIPLAVRVGYITNGVVAHYLALLLGRS